MNIQCIISAIILSIVMEQVLCHVLQISPGSKWYSNSSLSFMTDSILLRYLIVVLNRYYCFSVHIEVIMKSMFFFSENIESR